MREETETKRRKVKEKAGEETAILKIVFEKLKEMMNMENLEGETARMVERVVIVRVATKHINLWIRQLEMKRREICELVGLLMLDEVRRDRGGKVS